MLHNQLTCHHQCIVVSSTVKNGSVVLVKENSVPTLSWPPGVAKAYFLVRAVWLEVSMSKLLKELFVSLCRLCDLELSRSPDVSN